MTDNPLGIDNRGGDLVVNGIAFASTSGHSAAELLAALGAAAVRWACEGTAAGCEWKTYGAAALAGHDGERVD